MRSRPRTLFATIAAVLTCSIIAVVGDDAVSEAAYPGDNGRLVFVAMADGAYYEDIWTVEPDGSGLVQLTDTPDIGEWYPKWSPDGSRIAYTATGSEGENRQVWVMDHDGSNPTQVTDLPVPNGAIAASWSPDGDQLVFAMEYWGASPYDLYAIDVDGTDLTQITDLTGSEVLPAWSPDGTRIAFYSYELGTTASDIWTVAPDGSDLTQVTSDPRRFHKMDWSPDGSQLVFEEYDGLIFDHRVWVVDADGTDATPITAFDSVTNATEPAWSPDGTRIAHRRNEQLWTMDTDGSDPTPVGVNGRWPDWQPLAQSPAAEDDGPYDAWEDAELSVAAPGVLENDTDPSGEGLAAVQTSDASNGVVVLNPDGSFTYWPDAGFVGVDSFTYRAESGALSSGVATVSINVEPVGYLRVVTDPAVSSQIVVDGELRDRWGLTWVKVPPGTHEVAFTDIQGFTTPEPQIVTVDADATAEVTGVFGERGWLQVATSPPLAGTVSVDGVPMDDWGVWTDLEPGSYEVCFGLVEGYDPPGCETAVVAAGATTVVTGTYLVNPVAVGPAGHGYLRVTTDPAVPAQILVDGVPRDTWGLNWLKLDPGSYQVAFTDIVGFTTPEPQTVAVVAGETTEVVGGYVERGWLHITTSPALPATIFANGVPMNDWGVWTDLPTDGYTVSFSPVAGYTTPLAAGLGTVPGETTEHTGIYTPNP